MQKYLIKSIGRTGSHQIVEYFQRHGFAHSHIHFHGGFLREGSKEAFYSAEKLVIFCHEKDFIPDDPQNYFLINSIRRDKFDQFCSFEVARKTNQWTEYSRRESCDAITIDINYLVREIKAYTNYEEYIRTQSTRYKWKGYTEVYYEDIKQNPRLLFDMFPLEESYNEKLIVPWAASPYKYEQIFTNYEQAKLNIKKQKEQ
jgi:hypothetical protein